jgi:hypothetical protein
LLLLVDVIKVLNGIVLMPQLHPFLVYFHSNPISFFLSFFSLELFRFAEPNGAGELCGLLARRDDWQIRSLGHIQCRFEPV